MSVNANDSLSLCGPEDDEMDYLMPVLTRIVDLPYRTWLENIYESARKEKEKQKQNSIFKSTFGMRFQHYIKTWFQLLTRTAALHP